MAVWRVDSRPINNPTVDDLPLPPSPLERFELGLGDFIIYSVLVAKSYIFAGLLGAIFSIVFLIFGLMITVMVLILIGYALPAIPIPIALGLVAQLMTKYLAGPFGDQLNSAMIFL